MSRLLLSLLFAPFFSAHASDVILAGDKAWGFVEEVEPLIQSTVCRAFRQKSDSLESVELSVSYPKDGLKAPLILIKTAQAVPWVSIKLSSREQVPLFLLHASTAAGDPNVFWYAPVDFAKLEHLIGAADTLEVTLGPNVKPTAVKISLSGSSRALSEAERCLGKAPSSQEFFKALVDEKSGLAPDLGDHSPAFLFRSVDEAFAAYRRTGQISAALEVLRKPYRSVLRKAEKAQTAADSALTNRDDAQTALAAGQALVVAQEDQLAQEKVELDALQKERPAAEQILAAKTAVYTPLKEQMKPYEQRVDAAERAVHTLQSAIENDEALIPRRAQNIRSLESERSSLKNSIPGLEDEARRLRFDYESADRAYSAYDRVREKQRILDGDWSYRSTKDGLENKRLRLSDAQRRRDDARRNVSRLESELRNCQSDPALDCSGIQSQLGSASSDERLADGEASSLRFEISDDELRLRSAEDDADRKVNQESDRLRSERDELERRWRNKSSEVNSNYERINEINSEVEQLRGEIERAEQELPGLRTQLVQANSEAAQSQVVRDQFAKQIGFAAAESEFTAALNYLTEVKEGIAAKTKGIPRLEKSLAGSIKAVPSLQKSLDRAQTALTAAQADLSALEAQLKPLREQEAPLSAELSVESDRFKRNQAIFQTLYAELDEVTI